MTREEKFNLLNELLEYEEKNDIGNLTRADRREFQQWISEALEQEPILDRVKQARKEIENEVKFWSDPSNYNVESMAYVRKAKARSYKHCLEILDKLIESEG